MFVSAMWGCPPFHQSGAVTHSANTTSLSLTVQSLYHEVLKLSASSKLPDHENTLEAPASEDASGVVVVDLDALEDNLQCSEKTDSMAAMLGGKLSKTWKFIEEMAFPAYDINFISIIYDFLHNILKNLTSLFLNFFHISAMFF